eukprot:CAMPEP_0179064990 /NCGR_PEP_ID=MMETSP0796-20121207/28228_1 /TAXON_ID=73915 /ORGANISM="Pyrodinium bahamense, Strain pbaha01" /LENGTH=92 /DNA_ID=CAMNT_0020761945 /DNA_START=246 /DNA_END=524 /DNA_ORIENTATION=+
MTRLRPTWFMSPVSISISAFHVLSRLLVESSRICALPRFGTSDGSPSPPLGGGERPRELDLLRGGGLRRRGDREQRGEGEEPRPMAGMASAG